ncbi:KEOPS complex subunit Pcc1 [Salinibaculum rarum]|uniref:KEOPS complex subunit Pcc1 n=1 Tax=Salinibaculum rarum TaxID=3058903 RepID=UPI00265E1336|nr:KEOPS complex subunit Pcc1 [Salinibaculum sp. KK48]
MTSKKSPSSDHDAVLTFAYEDAERARRVERAIRPEIGDIDGDRSTVSLDRESATLELTVHAADLVALRAGLNTWCTLVTVAEQAGDAVA